MVEASLMVWAPAQEPSRPVVEVSARMVSDGSMGRLAFRVV